MADWNAVKRIDPDRIWGWFRQVMTAGEAIDFSDMLKNILQTTLNPVFDDYLTSGDALAKGASAPDFVELRDGLFMNAFAGTGGVAEQAFFEVHILHGFRAGQQPTFHVHWTHNQAAPSGDVKWFLDYSYSDGYSNGIFPAPTTLSVVQTAGAQYTHHITDDDSMVVTESMEPDGVLICRLYRDPADVEDTFEADAFIVEIDMHYERDKIGTAERARPYTGF